MPGEGKNLWTRKSMLQLTSYCERSWSSSEDSKGTASPSLSICIIRETPGDNCWGREGKAQHQSTWWRPIVSWLWTPVFVTPSFFCSSATFCRLGWTEAIHEDSYAATIPAATHKAQVVITAKLVEIQLVMYLILEAINYYYYYSY